MKQPLVRSSTDKFIAGVCGGIAKSFGIDAAIVRIIFVALAIFGFSFGIILYLLGWFFLPTEKGGPTGFDDLRRTFTATGANNDLR